jgi:hypothetical protein
LEVAVEQRWWWCLQHQTVEPDLGCAGRDRLGPFATVEEASRALQTVRERNVHNDAEDAAWESGEKS